MFQMLLFVASEFLTKSLYDNYVAACRTSLSDCSPRHVVAGRSQ